MGLDLLSGTTIRLRALEKSDLDFLYALENDESVWEVSNTTTPYSKFVLKQYLENAHRDIFEVKQLRLVIVTKEDEKPAGLIDLFDFDPKHQRAGIGIIIYDEEQRGKGYGREALMLLAKYAFTSLRLHQLYAHIAEDNHASIALFESLGYQHSGTRRDWIITENGFKNDLIYQLIHEKS